MEGGGAIAHERAGTYPNVRLGAINCMPSDAIFPSQRMMPDSGIRIGNVCGQINFFRFKALPYFPVADFISWMQSSYSICSFNQSLISLTFRPIFFWDNQFFLNIRLLKQVVLNSKCVLIFLKWLPLIQFTQLNVKIIHVRVTTRSLRMIRGRGLLISSWETWPIPLLPFDIPFVHPTLFMWVFRHSPLFLNVKALVLY